MKLPFLALFLFFVHNYTSWGNSHQICLNFIVCTAMNNLLDCTYWKNKMIEMKDCGVFLPGKSKGNS